MVTSNSHCFAHRWQMIMVMMVTALARTCFLMKSLWFNSSWSLWPQWRGQRGQMGESGGCVCWSRPAVIWTTRSTQFLLWILSKIPERKNDIQHVYEGLLRLSTLTLIPPLLTWQSFEAVQSDCHFHFFVPAVWTMGISLLWVSSISSQLLGSYSILQYTLL